VKIYADTSVLLAWFYPADAFAPAVTQWLRNAGPDFIWNIFLRAELRHNLRKLTDEYGVVAWQAYRASEAARRLTLGRDSAHEILEWADEMSARHAAKTVCGTWDCVHVAAALHSKPDVFATCDTAQAELARLVGIRKIKLFKSDKKL
jgi:predicted nucleic acid-binding protein